MEVKLKWISPNAEQEIVEIARVSSSRNDKKENPEPLIKYLINNKHWSPFEMANICISLKTSRAISRQILRHRSFSFQEFSQRYAKAVDFEPVELRRQADKNRQSSEDVFDPVIAEKIKSSELINSILENINSTYNQLLNEGVAKECARMILPGCTQTHLYMNGTVRSWIHFLQLRDDGHAQKEAQEIAKEIKAIFKTNLPIVSSALNW